MNSFLEPLSIIDIQANRVMSNEDDDMKRYPLTEDEIQELTGTDEFTDVDRHAARIAQDVEERTGRFSEHSSELIRRETEEKVRKEYLANQKREISEKGAIKDYRLTEVRLPSEMNEDYRKLGTGTLRVERRIYNVSSYQRLSIIDRTNLPFTIKSRAAGNIEMGLYVELVYHLKPNAVPEDIGFMNTRTFKGVLNGQQKAAYCNMVPGKDNEYSLVYFIPDKHINLDNQHLYIEDLDILVYSPDVAVQPVHPFSSAQEIKNYEDALRFIKDEGFNYVKMVRYNTHDLNNSAPIYLNSNGAVMTVPAVNRHDIAEGITVLENGASTLDDPGHKETVVRQYSLSEIGKPGFFEAFSRLDDAAALGNLKEMQESTKRKLELELIDKTVLREKIKAENEERFLELKKREMELLDKVNEEKARHKAREQKLANKAMKAKDKYEKRSLKTKTTSDLLKYAPTIIGGAVTVASLLYGVSRKTSIL